MLAASYHMQQETGPLAFSVLRVPNWQQDDGFCACMCMWLLSTYGAQVLTPSASGLRMATGLEGSRLPLAYVLANYSCDKRGRIETNTMMQ
jgi:hypothetical protein